jgi:hypothetical protein
MKIEERFDEAMTSNDVEFIKAVWFEIMDTEMDEDERAGYIPELEERLNGEFEVDLDELFAEYF